MEATSNHARIGRLEVLVERLKLRAWLDLEEKRTAVLESAKNKDNKKLVSSIFSFISIATKISVEELESAKWYEVADVFSLCYQINTPKIKFPMIFQMGGDTNHESAGWDYPDRSWYLWANLLAKSYGWSLEYVADLDIDDAIGLIQEILVDEQLDREWEWGLSENAYSYDEISKKSKFNPLKRPAWMDVPKKETVENMRIPASQLPAGIIMRWDDGSTTKPQ